MILIGHPLVSYECIYKISDKEDFKKKPHDSLFLFEWDEELIRYSKKNGVRFMVYAKNEKEAILANSLDAKAIIVPLGVAKQVQELAEYYLFDTKVALLLKDEQSLDIAIKNRVDMVVFEDAIR